MDVKKTKAWNHAEWDYARIYADIQMGGLLGAPDGETIERRLRAIARKCPQFYPAVLELGLHRLAEKGGPDAERTVEDGFRLLLELAEPEHAAEEIDGVIEVLEKMWRFDVTKRLIEMLNERQGLGADAHDSLAHAEARLGNLKAAQHHIDCAIELAPDRWSFWSNKCWYHMMAGEVDEAGKALDRALRPKRNDPVVAGNRKILKYLAARGGTFQDYLERPLDRDKIDRYRSAENWDRLEKLVGDFNSCRMEAFAQAAFLEGGQKRACLPDVLATLRSFFEFVSGMELSDEFLNEDIVFVIDNFKPIIHRFILKFGDVNRGMLQDVFESLLAYYGYLASRGIVKPAQFDLLSQTIEDSRDELMDKMERYNAVRHNPAVSETKKEKIRQELFGGDCFWPEM